MLRGAFLRLRLAHAAPRAVVKIHSTSLLKADIDGKQVDAEEQREEDHDDGRGVDFRAASARTRADLVRAPSRRKSCARPHQPSGPEAATTGVSASRRPTCASLTLSTIAVFTAIPSVQSPWLVSRLSRRAPGRLPAGIWQARRESNPQPPVLETGALPIELLACISDSPGRTQPGATQSTLATWFPCEPCATCSSGRTSSSSGARSSSSCSSSWCSCDACTRCTPELNDVSHGLPQPPARAAGSRLAARGSRPTYCRISVTVPAPTVRPPSRIANRNPFSSATGVISSISHRHVVARHHHLHALRQLRRLPSRPSSGSKTAAGIR